MSTGAPRDVLRLFGVDPVEVELAAESGNAHWFVRVRSGGDLVLRRFAAHHSAGSVEYERAVLDHLHSLGWPVAPVLGDPLVSGGRWWAIFPRLQGVPARWDRGDARHRWRGRLLADLHTATAPLVRMGQRDGYHRHDESAELTAEHAALLVRLRHLDRPRAVAWEHHVRRIAEAVAFLEVEGFPVTVVHGDFLSWNLLFENRDGTGLSGVLDFDAAHLDARAADVAFATWGGRHPEVVDGYNEAVRLSEQEETALPVLWHASWLAWGWELVRRSRDRVEPELDAVLEKLTRPWGG